MKISYKNTPLSEDPRDQEQIFNWHKKSVNDWKVADISSWKDLSQMVNSSYRMYSAGIFAGGKRNNESWQDQELIMFDIDDGMTLQEGIDFFMPYEGIIVTSKSHQKEKGKSGVADRFRVILATKEKININFAAYSDTMRMLMDNYYPFVDGSCKDAARFYFGFSGGQTIYLSGAKRFDFNLAVGKMKKIKELELFQRTRAANEAKPMGGYEPSVQGESLVDKFNENHTVEEMLEQYGYKKAGKRWISPFSSTGLAGVTVENFNGRVIASTFHNSDPWDKADAFQLYATFEYDGDKSKAALSLRGKR